MHTALRVGNTTRYVCSAQVPFSSLTVAQRLPSPPSMACSTSCILFNIYYLFYIFFVRVQSTLQPSPQQTCQSSLLDTVMGYCSLPTEARALYLAMATPTPLSTSRCRTKGPWGGSSRGSTRPASTRSPRSPRGRTGSPSPRAKRLRLHRPPGAAALPTREPQRPRHRLVPLARGRARQAAMQAQLQQRPLGKLPSHPMPGSSSRWPRQPFQPCPW